MTLPLPLPTGARARALGFDSFDVPPPVRGPLPSFVTEVLPRNPNNPRQPKPVITKAEKAAKRRAAKGLVTVIRNNHELIIDPSKLPKPPEGLNATDERAWAWANLTDKQFGMWNTLAWEKRRVAEGRPIESRNPKRGELVTVWLGSL